MNAKDNKGTYYNFYLEGNKIEYYSIQKNYLMEILLSHYTILMIILF